MREKVRAVTVSAFTTSFNVSYSMIFGIQINLVCAASALVFVLYVSECQVGNIFNTLLIFIKEKVQISTILSWLSNPLD